MSTKMKVMAMASSLSLVLVSTAAGFEAGQGIANDLATGANKRDVTFVERGGNNAYGWQSYDMALGATFLPWSLPNAESSVYGLRFDFGWGAYVDTYGLDAGLFSVSSRDFGGISANFLGNSVGGTMGGIQVGAVNIANAAYGLQIALVNVTDDLHGLQIGILNFNGSGLKCFPIINVGF